MKSVAAILITAVGLVALIAGILFFRVGNMHQQPGGSQQVSDDASVHPVLTTLATTAPATSPAVSVSTVAPPNAAVNDAIVLSAKTARIHGYRMHLDREGDGQIVYWVDPQEYLEWPDGCPRSGKFTIELTYSCAKEAGGSFQISAGPHLLKGKAHTTGDWKTYRTKTVGTITLLQEHTSIVLKCDAEIHSALMNVKQLRLIPVSE